MDNMTFENALKRLSEISVLMENGTPTLDESMQLYEEGIKLSKFCAEKLDEAEQKIVKLSETSATGVKIELPDETMDFEDFDGDDLDEDEF